MNRIPFFETFEKRGEKSIRLGAYILIKDITKGRRVGSSAYAFLKHLTYDL